MRAIHEQVVPGVDEENQCVAGASRLPNDAGPVYQVLGTRTEPVKAKVREFWALVRREVTGVHAAAAAQADLVCRAAVTQRHGANPDHPRHLACPAGAADRRHEQRPVHQRASIPQDAL
jgi:hypothetical protein